MARASDFDGDGYNSDPGPGRDCNDFNASIHPNAQEVIDNDIDEDCDGFDGVRRFLTVKQFPQTGPLPSILWTWSGTVSQTDGEVKVGSVLVGSPAEISKTYSMTIPHGRVHAVLGVTANPAASTDCKLRVKTSPLGSPTFDWSEWTLTGQGTGMVTTGDLNVNPAPRVLKEIRISCAAFGSVTVDWLTLQNTDDGIAPPGEMSLSWNDLGMAGGGWTAPIIRGSQSSGMLSDYLFGGSDVGGVAIKDLLLDTPWTPIVGEGATALTSQPELAIWDILGASWDEVFVLTGRDDDNEYISGGLYRGVLNSGDWAWEELVDSYDGNGTGVNIGAMGRYSACSGSGSDKEFAGGRLLVEETDSTGVYIANHQIGHRGLDYWDVTNETACELAAGDLPDDPIGAIARVASEDHGVPALLVGIRVRTSGDPALYLCSLPADDTDSDGYDDTVNLECGVNNDLVDCQPVDWTEGVDVRDIEVDPLYDSIAYIAVGGDTPATTPEACEDNAGGVYQLTVSESGTAAWADGPADISDGIADIDKHVDVTGVSMDPDGDFLYAFLPLGHGNAYERDRVYRIDTADIGTPDQTWEALNGDDDDEATRESQIDYADGWLGADSVVKPRPHPAQYAPGGGVDATWYEDTTYASTTCQGSRYNAVIPSNYNAWMVSGLDWIPSCDVPGATWDGDADTTWTFWPETSGDRVWQNTAANDVAIDDDGNVWTAVSDLGLFQSIPASSGEFYGELDCLWGGLPAGGAQVEAVEGAVWATFYDQGISTGSDDCPGCDIPHSIAVVRTLPPYGDTWEYMGAALDSAGHFQAIGLDGYDDGLVCADDSADHYANPFGNTIGDEGNAFADGSEDPLDPSWGQPMALDAFSADVAIVGFRSYSYDDDYTSSTNANTEVSGRIGYTLDGGVSWESVAFEPDFSGTLASGLACTDYHDCLCDEYAFFEHVNGIALLSQSDRTWYDSATDWQLEFFVSSRYNNASVEQDHCALARVVVNPSSTEWEWYGLDGGGNYPGCALTGKLLGGVSTSRWGTDAYIWGRYNYYPTSGVHRGGVCTASIDTANAYSQVVVPSAWPFGIGSVTAHPFVSDLIAIAPQMTASDWYNCKKDTVSDCPVEPRVLLGERTGTTWQLTQLDGTAPNSNATAIEWTPLEEPGLVMSSAGGGGWWGNLEWQ